MEELNNKQSLSRQAELVITEDLERQVIFVETPKRKERIKIFVPPNGFGNWRVTYENGHKIPELQGTYLSRKLALNAVTSWLSKERMSDTAKHDAWFGPDKKRVLRKKKIGTKTKTIDS